MTKKRKIMIGAGVVLALIIIGAATNAGKKGAETAAQPPSASSSSSSSSAPTSTASSSKPVLTVSAPAQAVTPTSSPVATTSEFGTLRPTEATKKEMAAALLVIDARMTNVERFMDRTINTCDDIRHGHSGDELVARVQVRFAGNDVPDFSTEQAQQVIDKTVEIWCH